MMDSVDKRKGVRGDISGACLVSRTRAMKCVVSCGSGMVRQSSPADQSAIRDQIVTLRIKDGLNDHCPRLILVELEGSQEIHLFDRSDAPPG